MSVEEKRRRLNEIQREVVLLLTDISNSEKQVAKLKAEANKLYDENDKELNGEQ